MTKKILEQIQTDLKTNDVVLYLKGTAAFPMCGFSASAVQILSQLGTSFKVVNVLENEMVRQEIKTLSGWPKIPQLFVKGRFIGGSETIRAMFNNGDLEKLFEEEGLIGNIQAA